MPAAPRRVSQLCLVSLSSVEPRRHTLRSRHSDLGAVQWLLLRDCVNFTVSRDCSGRAKLFCDWCPTCINCKFVFKVPLSHRHFYFYSARDGNWNHCHHVKTNHICKVWFLGNSQVSSLLAYWYEILMMHKQTRTWVQYVKLFNSIR